MATTTTPTGSLMVAVAAVHSFDVDTTGVRQGTASLSRSFQCVADLPDIIGMSAMLSAAVVVCAAGEWHLADPADPFQGMGDSKMHDDLSGVGKSLKMLVVIASDDNTDTVTVRVPVANGCPILNPAGAGYDIKPGSLFIFLDPTGTLVSSLVRGTNDIIKIEVSGGAPEVSVLAIYGE